MSDSKKALHAVTRARTVLLVSQPFFGCLALHLELVEVTDPFMFGTIPMTTMAVDGVHMYYYTPFVLSLTEDELIGVVAHEVFHCVYQHFSRRGHRKPLKWNYAGDYVINADLLEARFVLPPCRLFDPQFKGMSTEEVYERIPDPPESGGGGKAGNDPGGCGGVMDAGGASGDKAAADAVAREWETTVRIAVGVAKNANAGRLPSYLERLVTDLKRPRVSWYEQTREFIDQSMTMDYTWQRPNRRFISQGLILPGFIPDSLHHLVMAIDVSGSVTDEMVTAMVSEAAGALDQGTADILTIIYADAVVQCVDEFLRGDIVKAKTPGKGGTDFRPTFDWIKEHAEDASCVVYLTDLMTSDFGDEPPCPVLWGVYLPTPVYQVHHKTVPFGTCIHVDAV